MHRIKSRKQWNLKWWAYGTNLLWNVHKMVFTFPQTVGNIFCLRMVAPFLSSTHNVRCAEGFMYFQHKHEGKGYRVTVVTVTTVTVTRVTVTRVAEPNWPATRLEPRLQGKKTSTGLTGNAAIWWSPHTCKPVKLFNSRSLPVHDTRMMEEK